MKANVRHFKFINGQTGNVIAFFSIDSSIDECKIKENLEREQKKLAIEKGVYLDTIYWQEIKD